MSEWERNWQLTIKSRTRPKNLPEPTPTQRLPDRPQPIHLPMVQIKDGIPRAHEPIVPRITPNGEMPTRVQALPGFEKAGKCFEGGVGTDQGDHVAGFEVVGEFERDIAFEAARVVVESRAGSNSWLVACRTQIHGVVLKGTGCDAAAARGGRDGTEAAEGGGEGSVAVGDVDAVAAHRVGGTREDFGGEWIGVGEGPVPVGLRAGVATFRAEELVVEVGVVAMPVKEDALDLVLL